MVIDTSALVAVFLGEPERQRFMDLILAAERKLISAATAVEAGIVLEHRASETVAREFDLFLHNASIQIVFIYPWQSDLPRIACRKYGKGRHRVALHLGMSFTHDCG